MLKFVYWPPELVLLPAVRPLRSAFVDGVPCGVPLTVTQWLGKISVLSSGFVLAARIRK